ncbi:MAG: hypothetical protein KF773_19120 [Deltaproteobacteria bacterium]|nr:hypothetical protein [Deltaproteobacteria bacterium]
MHRLAFVVVLAAAACRGGADTPPTEPDPKAPPAGKSTSLGRALRVDVDGAGACALLADGGVACWGNGQPAPRLVPKIADAVEVVQSCARRASGTVTCWNADLETRDLDGATGALQLARGPDGPCLVTAARTVACAGEDGKLASVAGFEDVRALGDHRGAYHCAALAGGRVACAGRLDGLGLASSTEPTHALVPDIADAVGIVTISQGRACALDRAGAPRCFGPDAAKLPARVDQLSGNGCVRRGAELLRFTHRDDTGWDWRVADAGGPIADVSCSGAAGCVALATGAVRCWGPNDRGQLGDGVATTARPPAKLEGLPPMVAVGAGHGLTVALSKDGQLWAWGFMTHGPRLPVRVLDGVTHFAVGNSYVLAARGRHAVAVLDGDHKIITERLPELPDDPRALAAGDPHTACAALADKTLRCLRDGAEGASWQTVAGATDLVQLSTSHDLCGVTSAGGALCVLRNDDGTRRILPLAVDKARRIATPWIERTDGTIVRVGDDGAIAPHGKLAGITSIGDGGFAWSPACGLRGGAVVCWNESGGKDAFGVLGRGAAASPGDTRHPEPLRPELRATAVAAGYAHACAVDEAGAVWCWGDDRDGGLGRGRVVHAPQPTPVVELGP